MAERSQYKEGKNILVYKNVSNEGYKERGLYYEKSKKEKLCSYVSNRFRSG